MGLICLCDPDCEGMACHHVRRWEDAGCSLRLSERRLRLLIARCQHGTLVSCEAILGMDAWAAKPCHSFDCGRAYRLICAEVQ